MDAKVALDKIKETEERAALIVQDAKLKTRDIIKSAQQEKERILKEAGEKAKADIEKLKTSLQKETLQEVSGVEKRLEEEIGILKEKALSRLGEATRFLKEKIQI